MKIGLIVPGGVDRSGRILVIPVLLALIERLATHHEVVVISLDPNAEPSEYELLGARVVNLGLIKARNRLSWAAVALAKLISTLRAARGGFDLLHAFWVFPQGTLAVAAGCPVAHAGCCEHRRRRVGLAAFHSLWWNEDMAKPNDHVGDPAHGKCSFWTE